MACAAASDEDSAVEFNQPNRGCAAAAIDSDAALIHCSVLSRVITESKADAAVINSAAMLFHAAAAASIGAAPAPAYIAAEFTSGGKAPKSTSTVRSQSRAVTVGGGPVLPLRHPLFHRVRCRRGASIVGTVTLRVVDSADACEGSLA
jgi:hypothetical protein